MASIVQSAKSAENVSSLAFGSNVTSGNLLLVALGVANSALADPASISDTRSNTWTQAGYYANPATGNDVALFFATANSSGACTVSVTGSGFGSNASQIMVAELSGTFTTAIDSVIAQRGTVGLSQDDIVFTAQYYAGNTAITVSGSEAILQNSAFSDRSFALSWEQTTGSQTYATKQSAGSNSGAITVAFRVANTAPTAPYFRQTASSPQNITTLKFPGKVQSGNLLVVVFGQANGVIGNPKSISDTLASSWTQAAIQSNAAQNGCSMFYAVLGTSGADTVTTTWASNFADEFIVIEIGGFDFRAIDTSGAGTTDPTLTLADNTDVVITAAYYSGITTPTVSGADALVVDCLFSDRSMAVAWNVHPAGGSYTCSLAVGTIPAFVSVAFSPQFIAQDVAPTSIGSDEAFGAAFIAASIAPDGIASAEAFGTLALITVVVPSGIASAEAFGSPFIAFDQVINAAAIASAEAFGRPRVVAPQFARLKVNGANRTDYIFYGSSASWNLLIGQRGSCMLPLIVEPDDEFAPQIGEQIEIFDPSDTRVWLGTVETVETRWFGDDGWKLVTLTGVTYESLFETTQVDKLQYTATAAGTIFAALYAASGITAVSLGTVDAGETIASLQVTRLSDAFASLALQSNKVWGVDPATAELYFRDPLAVAAPWTMAAEDMVWESMAWKQTRADFRDAQVIQLPDGSAQITVANTPDASIGNRTQRLTLTSAFTSAGAVQEATAALKRYSTMPSQLTVDTDRPGISQGQLLTIAVDHPVGASALLNGAWLVVEVDARIIPGLDQIDPVVTRMPADLVAGDKLGHYRYTLHLVNSLASAVFRGDATTTVFALPRPGTVASMKVIPDDVLYSKSATSTEVTVTPAMPAGSTLLVTYAGDTAPGVPNFLDTLGQLAPMAPTAGPAGGDSGEDVDTHLFAAELSLTDLTAADDIAPHPICYHGGTAVRGLAVLRKTLSSDLTVRINKNGHEIVTVTIPDTTVVDTVIEFDVVTGSPPLTAVFADKDVLSADILEGDGQIDKNGVAVITIQWSDTF